MALKRKVASPPPSPTFRATFSSGLTALSAIPIGVWINIYSSELSKGKDIASTITEIGRPNWYLLGGAFILLLNIGLLYWWDLRETNWQQAINFSKARKDLTIQTQILKTYCSFISEILNVKVSGRVFEARLEVNEAGSEEFRLYQARELFVENERFPQELAFTYIKVSDDNFVSARSFRERAPKFETLPHNHSEMYKERERRMVEPRQRWVLAAPILRYDYNARARDELEPRGMVVFYGKAVPKATMDQIENVKTLCRDVAEIFSGFSIGAGGH